MKLEGYTPSMRESLDRVVASRPARLHETWPMMSPADKQEIGRASVGKECRSRWSPDH